IRHDTTVETHAFLRQPVQIRRLDELARIVVGANRLVAVVVREDKQDVRSSSVRRSQGYDPEADSDEEHQRKSNQVVHRAGVQVSEDIICARCLGNKIPGDADRYGCSALVAEFGTSFLGWARTIRLSLSHSVMQRSVNEGNPGGDR